MALGLRYGGAGSLEFPTVVSLDSLDSVFHDYQSALKEAWRPTIPHGREGLILAPCKVNPRAFFPSGVICVSRAKVLSL